MYPLARFVHEGNGDLWSETLKSPRRLAGWVLVEERAEGGDMIYAMSQDNPDFLSGFARTASGGGLALYRRTN